jgi:hypothetical protein
MTGGTLLAVGSIFMGGSQAPDASSTQCSVSFDFASNKQANTYIHLRYSNGTQIFTFKVSKLYRSVVFCSPELKVGLSYSLYTGGSSTGPSTDGMYSGTYNPGTLAKSFSISSIVTKFTGVP